VDGVSVTNEDTSYLRGLIQADYNKTALVTVLRADGETVDFSVSCEVIYTSPVSYELLEGSVGYVSITNFRQGAGADAIAAIEDLIGQGAQSLVLDVRSNPGGQVTELVELLDYLLPEGDIFIRADKQGREVVETSDASCVEMPMAVLVNGDSYSAAEFFAAALREYDWATVVGEPTTGKARSQVTIPLWDGSAVHISKYTYLTPHRQDLYEAGGIVPDVEIALTEEERSDFETGWLELADDPQVQAAIAALNA
jgi:carboxyl-terminal processing protease